MALASVLFTAQLTLRTLVVAHACLKTYQRARRVYRWLHPPAACLWNSFVYVDVVPTDIISSPDTDGRQEETGARRGDARGSREEEEAEWVKL